MKIFDFIYWFRFEITTFIITGLALICGKDWHYFWIGCVTAGIGEILRRIYLLELKISIKNDIRKIYMADGLEDLEELVNLLKESANKERKKKDINNS